MWDKSTSSLKSALACFVSVLKSISFVFKWKRVVSVLSPLSLKSYGGSQLIKHKCQSFGYSEVSYKELWPCHFDLYMETFTERVEYSQRCLIVMMFVNFPSWIPNILCLWQNMNYIYLNNNCWQYNLTWLCM